MGILLRQAIEEAAIRAKVPRYNTSPSSKQSALSPAIKRLMAERTKLNSLLSTKGNVMTKVDKQEKISRLGEINEEIFNIQEAEADKEERKAVEDIKVDQKKFYKYANGKKKHRDAIGPLKWRNTYTSDSEKMAEILSQQYQSMYSTPRSHPNLDNYPTCNNFMENIISKKIDFEIAMEDLNDGAATGHDEIPAIVFRKFKEALSDPVKRIWRICLDEGILPNSPVLSIVTPIYHHIQRWW